MNRNSRGSGGRTACRPTCEPLEGRSLLSGLNIPPSLQSALLAGINQHSIATMPAGVSAVVSALRGGPGSEFVSLLRQELKNPAALLSRFTSGSTTQAMIPGAVGRIATIEDSFTGSHYDYLAISSAGAIVLPKHSIELGAILRGPNRSPNPGYYVFAIDRGAGARLGSRFPERPGITPDALVTITVGPNNSSVSGSITDLTTGAATAVEPSQIKLKDSTLRVILNAAQLSSQGLPVSGYRYTFWVQDQLNGGIGSVGSFAPDATMNSFGVLHGGGR